MSKIFWTEDKLREVFVDSLNPYITRQTSHLGKLFDITSKIMTYNHYHNLNMVKEIFTFIELGANGKSKFGYIPKPVLVALFFQNVLFKSNDPNCYSKSATYARQALECYGVIECVVDEVEKLILINTRLTPPLNSESYAFRLMHDLRNARLAYNWELFRLNNLKLKTEFLYEFKAEDFLRLQYKLYNFLDSRVNLFSLNEFDGLTEKAKYNITKYKGFIKDDYFTALIKNDLKIKSPPLLTEMQNNNPKTYDINDVVEDTIGDIQYCIKEFHANDVKVTTYNSVLNEQNPVIGTKWSIIPNTVFWSPRFKLIKKSKLTHLQLPAPAK